MGQNECADVLRTNTDNITDTIADIGAFTVIWQQEK